MKKPSWWDKPITWGNYATMCVAAVGAYLLCVGGAYASYRHEYRKSMDKLDKDLEDLYIR